MKLLYALFASQSIIVEYRKMFYYEPDSSTLPIKTPFLKLDNNIWSIFRLKNKLLMLYLQLNADVTNFQSKFWKDDNNFCIK